jgi:hypothetical protein
MKNRFQASAFKFNLYRYATAANCVMFEVELIARYHLERLTGSGGTDGGGEASTTSRATRAPASTASASASASASTSTASTSSASASASASTASASSSSASASAPAPAPAPAANSWPALVRGCTSQIQLRPTA